jgi:hypothetical protein
MDSRCPSHEEAAAINATTQPSSGGGDTVQARAPAHSDARCTQKNSPSHAGSKTTRCPGAPCCSSSSSGWLGSLTDLWAARNRLSPKSSGLVVQVWGRIRSLLSRNPNRAHQGHSGTAPDQLATNSEDCNAHP